MCDRTKDLYKSLERVLGPGFDDIGKSQRGVDETAYSEAVRLLGIYEEKRRSLKSFTERGENNVRAGHGQGAGLSQPPCSRKETSQLAVPLKTKIRMLYRWPAKASRDFGQISTS